MEEKRSNRNRSDVILPISIQRYVVTLSWTLQLYEFYLYSNKQKIELSLVSKDWFNQCQLLYNTPIKLGSRPEPPSFHRTICLNQNNLWVQLEHARNPWCLLKSFQAMGSPTYSSKVSMSFIDDNIALLKRETTDNSVEDNCIRFGQITKFEASSDYTSNNCYISILNYIKKIKLSVINNDNNNNNQNNSSNQNNNNYIYQPCELKYFDSYHQLQPNQLQYIDTKSITKLSIGYTNSVTQLIKASPNITDLHFHYTSSREVITSNNIIETIEAIHPEPLQILNIRHLFIHLVDLSGLDPYQLFYVNGDNNNNNINQFNNSIGKENLKIRFPSLRFLLLPLDYIETYLEKIKQVYFDSKSIDTWTVESNSPYGVAEPPNQDNYMLSLSNYIFSHCKHITQIHISCDKLLQHHALQLPPHITSIGIYCILEEDVIPKLKNCQVLKKLEISHYAGSIESLVSTIQNLESLKSFHYLNSLMNEKEKKHNAFKLLIDSIGLHPTLCNIKLPGNKWMTPFILDTANTINKNIVIVK